MPALASRVLFLGLDGGTMSVLSPWFGRGLLPNLASLWRRSASGTLRSSAPMVTPVAWTSFATGCTPPVHGIHEFVYVEPSDRAIRANHAGRVRVPTLWQVLGAVGREVVSLNLPMTYPPPRVPGLVVAGADAPGLAWAFAQCPEFAAEIFAHVPDFTNKIAWKHRPRTLDDLRSRAAWNRAILRPGRRRRTGRPSRRLDRDDGPFPEPGQPPASALALPRRRCDGSSRAGLERRGRGLPPRPRRDRGPVDGAGLEARRGGHCASRTTGLARARRWSTSTACSAARACNAP